MLFVISVHSYSWWHISHYVWLFLNYELMLLYPVGLHWDHFPSEKTCICFCQEVYLSGSLLASLEDAKLHVGVSGLVLHCSRPQTYLFSRSQLIWTFVPKVTWLCVYWLLLFNSIKLFLLFLFSPRKQEYLDISLIFFKALWFLKKNVMGYLSSSYTDWK